MTPSEPNGHRVDVIRLGAVLVIHELHGCLLSHAVLTTQARLFPHVNRYANGIAHASTAWRRHTARRPIVDGNHLRQPSCSRIVDDSFTDE